MSCTDGFSFSVDFSTLPPQRIQQLCQLDESTAPTAELWVSSTKKLMDELHDCLKPAHIKKLTVDVMHPYVITVFVPYDHAVKAPNLLVRYFRTHKLTF